MNKSEWKINQTLDCNVSNCIYLVHCKKEACKMNYVGETKRIMKFRFAEHRGYDESQPTGQHFNSQGHSIADMSVLILEQVRSSDPLYRKEREKYCIRKFNTYYNGMNTQP